MKFPKLNFPESWSNYWSKYPEGFTVLESLISWTSQVNKMTEVVNDNQDSLKSKITHDDILKTYKMDKNGNFYGTWQGLNKPTLSDEGMRATVEKINEIDLPELTENYNSLVKRKFASKLGNSMNWAGTNYTVNEQKRKEQIDMCIEKGIDEIVLPIQIGFNISTEAYYIINDLSLDLKWVRYAIDNGMKVSCIKVHQQGINKTTIINNGIDKFKTQYKNLIEQIALNFLGLGIDYLTVLNEQTEIFKDSTWTSFVIELYNIAKGYGYKTGITCAGYQTTYQVQPQLFQLADVICANIYVRIGTKRERTTILDGVNAWKNDFIQQWVKDFKALYNKPLIISESGIEDYWVALEKPSIWVTNESLKVNSNGKTSEIYFIGMFEELKEVDRVWAWFTLPSKETCYKYLKGVEINE